MGQLLNALGFDVGKFLWGVFNFLVLLVILNKFAYKPVIKMLDERKKSVEDSLNQAEKAQQEAERIQKEYQAQMAAAKQEAQEIIEKANKMGDQVKAEIVTKAQDQANKTIQQAQEEIARAKNQAVAELRDEVANLTILAAGKVLGRAISVEDHEKMIKDFVAEVGDLKC